VAKRSQGQDGGDVGVSLTPDDQLAKLESLPSAPPTSKSARAPASPATDNPKTASEAMGAVKDGCRRVVIPGFDPLHVKGRPGASAILYGSKFFKEMNGDLVGDMPTSIAEAYVDTGMMVFAESHIPAESRDPDDIERARRAGRVLKV